MRGAINFFLSGIIMGMLFYNNNISDKAFIFWLIVGFLILFLGLMIELAESNEEITRPKKRVRK